MTLFWGLKKFPLRREIPALKDHLKARVDLVVVLLRRIPDAQ